MYIYFVSVAKGARCEIFITFKESVTRHPISEDIRV